MSAASGAPPASGEAPGPGHRAALVARGAIEEALFDLPNVPLELDRASLRDRLLRAIGGLYAVLDSAVVTAVHFDGLTEGAALVGEARALLGAAGDATKIEPLEHALGRLAAAEQTLRAAVEAVAQIQLARRAELVGGRLDEPPPAARPFRASVGLPSLHAIARRPLLPHVAVDRLAAIAAAPAPPVEIPRPASLEDLEAFAADAASGALEDRLAGDDDEAEPLTAVPVPLPFAYEPAAADAEVLRRIGRDCLEDIANHRTLRTPNAIESWLDQEPFEQRLLCNVDAFAALGGAVLPLISLYNAEAKIPDPERAFAVALTLGCIEGSDAAGAAVMILKQSAPETFPGFVEGFSLAPSPAVDGAMADLCRSPRADLVAVALDVLHARGAVTEDVIVPLLDHPEPEIALRVARALGRALPRDQAAPVLERMAAEAADPELFAAAVESLLRRRHGEAWALLRKTIAAPASPAHASRALGLLCLAGRASDLDAVVAALRAAPSASLVRMAGRYGHTGVLPALLERLGDDDPEVVAAAAEALERITGAGLRETVEEPWPIDLPAGAEEAHALPVPTHAVNKVVADPLRWRTWLDEHARDLPAAAKLRGVPFTPMQIVDELEAKATPPDRRAEAALELAVVTGLASLFSPADWVARQRAHLAELRARVASLAAVPGVWTLGAAAVEEAPRAGAERSRVTLLEPPGPAPPPLEGAPPAEAEAASAPQLPSFMVAARAAPAGKLPSHSAPAEKLPFLSTVIGASPFASKQLPFQPGSSPAPTSASSPTPPSRAAPSLGQKAPPGTRSPLAAPLGATAPPGMRSPLAAPLPFAGKLAETEKKAPPAPSLPFGHTTGPAVRPPLAPPLPFAAKPVEPEKAVLPSAAKPAEPEKAARPFGETTGPAVRSPLAPPLPFAPAPASSSPPEAAPARSATPGHALPFQKAPTAPATATPPPPPDLAASLPSFTVEQYAMLCVELWSEPARTLEIRARYHLEDGRTWSTFHWLWQDRLNRDPALHARWMQLTAQLKDRRTPR
jgi:HEAT repeat